MPTWSIDADHSVAAFAVGHMMVNQVRGQFNRLSGAIKFSPPDLSAISAEVVIEAASILTGVANRDEHLKSAEFLDVVRYPKIVFRSSAVEPLSLHGFLLSGFLTIHGVTHSINLRAEYAGPVANPEGAPTLGFQARARLNREVFGLAWNLEMAPHGFLVGKEVELELHLEAQRVS